MNKNSKSIKKYLDLKAELLKEKVHNIRNSAYSGVFCELAYIMAILVIMIDKVFPEEEVEKNAISKIVLIVLSLVFMFYLCRKIKKTKEIEKETNIFVQFIIQAAVELGYMNMPVSVVAIILTFDTGVRMTVTLLLIIGLLTLLALIQAARRTSKLVSMNK